MEYEYVQGVCRFKCPEAEMELRESNGLLHKFELKDESSYRRQKYPQADRNKMVKVYSRPAAGNEYNHAESLRPPDVLLCTVQYLITSICTRRDVPWSDVYEFVFDRLRAVRQDAVIQGIEDTSAAVSILQSAVAFHVYSAYRLCTAPPDQFDEKINTTHAQECLKRLLCIYRDSLHAQGQLRDTQTLTEAQKEAHTEAQTETQTEALKETQIEALKETQTEAQTETLTEAQTETQIEALKETQTEAQTETLTEAQTETQTEAQTETQIEALKETQTEAQTETQTEAQTEAQMDPESNETQTTETQKEPQTDMQTDLEMDASICQIQRGIENLNCGGGDMKSGQKTGTYIETRSLGYGHENRPLGLHHENKTLEKGQDERSNEGTVSQELGLSALASVCRCRQAEFVALYLLFNLGSTEALRLGMQWKSLLRQKYAWSLSLELSKAWFAGNYVRVLRLAEHLPPLLLCAFHRHIGHVHRMCLERMSHGYSSKTLGYPLRDLTALLHCDDDAETTSLCQHYNITVTGSKVIFLKANFNHSQPVPPMKQYDWITSRLQDVPVDSLLLGDSCSCLHQYIS